MDLPTCPACGQSVLDDETDECPFCGASMSGAPAKAPSKSASAKPKATAPAAAAAGASRSASADARSAPPGSPGRTAARKSVEPEPEPDAEDEPIAADRASLNKAVALAPQPQKGRRHRVVCPMCETIGYTSTKAAGRVVRCANPNCLVPIFTAPSIEMPAEPEPEAPRKPWFNTKTLAAGSGVALVLIGFAIWNFVLKGGGEPAGKPIQLGGSGDPGGADENGASANDKTTGNESTAGPGAAGRPAAGNLQPVRPALSADEVGRRAFQAMIDASRQGEQNRRPYSVRLTAEAYAVIGQTAEAYKQLERMNVVEPKIPWYAIPPLVEIGWSERGAGRTDQARAALDSALTVKGHIAQYGQDAWNTAVSLAALLAAFDRDKDAAGLLRDRDRDEERTPAVLWAQIRQSRAFAQWDAEQVIATSPLKPWTNPAVVAVTFELVARRQFDAARRWATGRGNPQEQADCLSTWAEWSARAWAAGDAQAPSLAQIQQGLSRQSPPGRAQALARTAVRLALEGRAEQAAAAVTAAREALAAVSQPAAFVLPDQSAAGFKQYFQLQLPDSTPLEQAAVAVGEIARAEAAAGHTDEAWQAVEQALAFARAIGPGQVEIQQRERQVEESRSYLERELAFAFELESQDQIRRRFNEYRNQMQRLAVAAQRRLALQSSVLSQAIDWKLADRVWALLDPAATSGVQDGLLSTSVPWRLMIHDRAAGRTDRHLAVQAAVKAAGHQPPPELALELIAAPLLAEGKAETAAQQLARVPLADDVEHQRTQMILRTSARLVHEDKVPQALAFLGGFRSAKFLSVRSDAYGLTAALATRLGHGTTVWELTKTGVSSMERVAACHGIVVALPATEQSAAADAAKGGTTRAANEGR